MANGKVIHRHGGKLSKCHVVKNFIDIHNLNLVAVSSEVSANFIAVDLLDKNKRIAFQVTSRNVREKIVSTIEKFNNAEVCEGITSLKILILDMKKRDYRKPHNFTLKNQYNFSLKEDIYDFEDICRYIQMKEKEKGDTIVRLYDHINMIFDSGRLKYQSISNETKYYAKKGNINLLDQVVWNWGYGDSMLTAFLPLNYKQELNCKLEIRKYNLSGCYFTFSEKQLLDNFFVSREEFMKKHSVGRLLDEDTVQIQFENTRFSVDVHTAENILKLFDKLKEKYYELEKEKKCILGIPDEEIFDIQKGYFLKSITLYQVKELKYFACNHDSLSENGDFEWNIFGNTANRNILQLCPYIKSDVKASVYAVLEIKECNEHAMLFWKPGWCESIADMEGFDNVCKWKADYTLQWIDEKLIPKAEEFSEKAEKSFFAKLIEKIFKGCEV